eukprot:TRINITY_DN14309_c0_g1_i1.p1 TRINITY_DN14309_c0_g1~~TRINITY_DN14309_c0_g1_i1.p1  ORF type:complete len:143 (-),score=5.64 TRINITY_DN14309_c0_g1_i1:368-796(-)
MMTAAPFNDKILVAPNTELHLVTFESQSSDTEKFVIDLANIRAGCGIDYYYSRLLEDEAERLTCGIRLENGLLTDRILVPTICQTLLILACHEHNGHLGVGKTWRILRQRWKWPRMKQTLYAIVPERSILDCRKLVHNNPSH